MTFQSYTPIQYKTYTPCKSESSFTRMYISHTYSKKQEENTVVYPENSMTAFINFLLSTSRTDKLFYKSFILSPGAYTREHFLVAETK